MRSRLLLIFALLSMSNNINACTGLNNEQLVESANKLVQEQIESGSFSKLFPLFDSSEHLYSQLKLITAVSQPRVAFEVLDCEPLTGSYKAKVLWFRPEIKKMAWVFKQNAVRNQPFDKILIEYQEVDLIKEKVNNSALAVGPFDEKVWLVQSVKKNEPILKKHLKMMPWVYKNQRVQVLAVSEGVTVETEGVAQQFGQYLDKVNVRLSSNNQLVRATIIKKGTVRID